MPHAEALVERGYNALLFDFRGHGESGGVRYTLGAVEERDVLGAVAYLESRGFAPARIGFWAHSMGAATVLLTSAASPDVRTIVADSSFARLHDLLDRQLPFASDLPSFFQSVHPLLRQDPVQRGREGREPGGRGRRPAAGFAVPAS